MGIMTEMPKIFIDGEYGTTGLSICQRLADLPIKLCSIPVEHRHDLEKRRQMMAMVDLVILCLPDEASREAVALIQSLEGRKPRILDASTAFRTNPEWVYGFAELDAGQEQKIAKADKVANPGCYSSGAIALLHPLVKAGIIPADYPLTINAVSGYSGGGKKMIAAYEQENDASPFELYALNLEHKHLPEICYYSGLTREPIFVPSVGNFAQGMVVSIPLHVHLLKGTVEQLKACLKEHYLQKQYVSFVEDNSVRLLADQLAFTDRMELRVHSNKRGDQVVLTARFDNLGKGASGAAVQNMKLMLNLS